jgi:hypothetical protein
VARWTEFLVGAGQNRALIMGLFLSTIGCRETHIESLFYSPPAKSWFLEIDGMSKSKTEVG